MGTVLAHPKPESYVNEWVAIRFDPSEGAGPVKLMLKGTPFSIFSGAIQGSKSYLIASDGASFWTINAGEWVVKSPHDKVWFMGESEFESQFNWRPES